MVQLNSCYPQHIRICAVWSLQLAASRNLDDDLEVDFSGILAAVWRAKFILLFISLLASIGMFVLGLWLDPRYKANSQVFVESRDVQITRNRNTGGEVESSRSDLDTQGVASIAQLIASPSNALKVIRDLELTKVPDLNPALDRSGVRDFLVLFGLPARTGQFAEERTLQRFMSRLSVGPVDGSRVIKVEFRTKSRELAAKIPNALVDTFLASQSNLPQPVNGGTSDFLKNQIAELREQVEEADRRISDYRSGASLDLTGGPNNTSIATQQLSDISTQLSAVRADRASAQSKADEIRRILQSGGAVDTVLDVQESPLIQRLVERQAGIRAQIAQLSSSLLPGHPTIRSLESQLSDLDAEIKRRAQNVVTGLDNQVKILSSNEEQLTEEFNRLRVTARDAESAGATLNKLESEAASLRELLSTYQLRFNQSISRIGQEANPINARIASQATIPAIPYFPKILPMTIAAFIGTLVLGVLWVLMRELYVLSNASNNLNTQMTGPQEQLEDVIASIVPEEDETDDRENNLASSDLELESPPQILQSSSASKIQHQSDEQTDNNLELQKQFLDRSTEVQMQKTSGLAEELVPTTPELDIYNVSEMAAILAMDKTASRIIVISPQGDSGASGCVDLARGLTIAGHQCILVDIADTQAGSTALLDMGYLTGISDLLAENAKFSEIIHKDPLSSLHMVPSGRVGFEQLGGSVGRLDKILQALEQNYTFVIVDCGSVSGAGAAKVACDGALGIVSVAGANKALLYKIAEDMQEAGFQSVPVMDSKLIDKSAGDSPTTGWLVD